MSAKALTVTRFAAELGVHPDTVRLWCRTGALRALRTPGGHYRIPRDELERMLAAA